jgi:hypothetical protein
MIKRNKISKDQCIHAICNYVRRYRTDEHTTTLAMYNDTGYSSYYSDIGQEEIEEFITKDIELIEAWGRFSEDKRWTPAWAFDHGEKEKWCVVYILPTGKEAYSVYFEDPAEIIRP